MLDCNYSYISIYGVMFPANNLTVAIFSDNIVTVLYDYPHLQKRKLGSSKKTVPHSLKN